MATAVQVINLCFEHYTIESELDTAFNFLLKRTFENFKITILKF